MASGRADYYFADIELTAMLAKMDTNIAALGTIADKLSTGEDMITVLDGLDGTIDGLLTLGELNSSQIHTDLVASIAELSDIVDNLDGTIGTLISELESVSTNTANAAHVGYYKVDTSEDTLIDLSAGSGVCYQIFIKAAADNTDGVSFTLKKDGTTKWSFTVEAGCFKNISTTDSGLYWNQIYVVADSGVQHYQAGGHWLGYFD